MIYEGKWGDWGRNKMCPYGKYIVDMKISFELCNDCDDTALNGMMIECRDIEWNNAEFLTVSPKDGDIGKTGAADI